MKKKSITIPETELYDEQNNCFITIKETTIQIEHSLRSLAEWEAKWHKPFIARNSQETKTYEETVDYIRCMTLTQCVDPMVYMAIPRSVIEEVDAYINEPMTATTFSKSPNERPSREVITAEIIYYQMISLGIPIEFERWHLNRLLTLIKVCAIKNEPNKKKMSKRELMNRNRSLNAARRRALGTTG